MNNDYITIRVNEDIKKELEKIKHKESIEQDKNLTLSQTIEYVIDLYYRYKDLNY